MNEKSRHSLPLAVISLTSKFTSFNLELDLVHDRRCQGIRQTGLGYKEEGLQAIGILWDDDTACLQEKNSMGNRKFLASRHMTVHWKGNNAKSP